MLRCACGAALAVVLLAGAWARADDRVELGGFFGPRVFSKDAQLGNVVDVEDTLSPGVVIGVRVSKPILSWLAIEAELPISTASTRTYNTDVFWFEPRVQARFLIFPKIPISPYAIAGAGMPVTLSSKRGIFGSGVTGDGFVGGGVQFKTTHGLALRVDARVGFQPGVQYSIEPELEIDAGLLFPLGKTAAEKRREH